MTLPGPVIVGGMGGSGSRPLVRMLMELRWFMAPRRNRPQEDALDVVDFDYRWTPPFVNGVADLERMRREFDEDVLPKLLPGGRWGWKHNPSGHLLPFYLERFPDLRFIHIVRDGRDAAVGSMGGIVQVVRLGRAILDGDPTPVTEASPEWAKSGLTAAGGREATPERLAAFWARSNRDIADFGERELGERYLRVRLEDLAADGWATVIQIARFLGVEDRPPQAARHVEPPASIGRWKKADLGAALAEMGDELVRFGYVEPTPRDPAELYIQLLRKSLAGKLSRQPRTAKPRSDGGVDILDGDPGRVGWPVDAETMLGLERLENIRHCVESVLAEDVPGDLIETGVWRGGSAIFMRGILAAHGARNRRVWVADSFQGLPEPDAATYPADEGSRLHAYDFLAVPEREVRASFERYGLLDDQVRFLAGWFRDTLPTLAAERFAVVRLDGDLYESTMVALESLYPRLSVGGYVIVDDYGVLPSCRRAVDEYRARVGIVEPIREIDWTGVFWRKERERDVSPPPAGDTRLR